MSTVYNGKAGNESRLAPLTVTGATNATPIEVTVSAPHGLLTGDRVSIVNVQGNLATNGAWTITVTSSTKFTLNGSVGSGAWTSGGGVLYLGMMPHVTLPADTDALTAASVNVALEDAKDAQAWLAERVSKYRLADVATFILTNLPAVGTYNATSTTNTWADQAAYNTPLNSSFSTYFDVQPGDIIEVSLTGYWVKMSGVSNQIALQFGLEKKNYGVAFAGTSTITGFGAQTMDVGQGTFTLYAMIPVSVASGGQKAIVLLMDYGIGNTCVYQLQGDVNMTWKLWRLN